MKKLLLIIIILIITALLLLGIWNALKIVGLNIALSKHQPKMSMEELASALYNNHNDFNNATNIFVKFPSIIDIDGYGMYGKEGKDNNGKYYYTTKNKLYIRAIAELDSRAIMEVENSKIKKIFDDLKFESINRIQDSIYFVEGSNLAFANGIVYSPVKKEPDYKYLIELERILDRWFYFKFR